MDRLPVLSAVELTERTRATFEQVMREVAAAVNGRVRIRRRHYPNRQDGTTTPIDALLEAAEATVSAGVREMCSRVGVEAWAIRA